MSAKLIKLTLALTLIFSISKSMAQEDEEAGLPVLSPTPSVMAPPYDQDMSVDDEAAEFDDEDMDF